MVLVRTFVLNIFIIILLINLVSAIPNIKIEIDIDPIFYDKEIIQFSYTITSSEDETIKYFAFVNCEEDIPLPLLELKNVSLKTNKVLSKNYVFSEVHYYFVSTNCNATVNIMEPYELTETKEFEIVTDPSFSFNIKLDKKIFIQNEDIYIDYSSDVENPSITATLTYPDKTTKQITLPGSIKAEQIGTYNLDATASKEGYKTKTQKIQFGVIEKQADIETISAPDLSEFVVSDKAKTRRNLFIGLVVGLVIIILIILHILKRRKQSGIISQVEIK